MHAQDFKKDLLGISKKMNLCKSYSVTLHYNLYIDKDLKTPFQQRDVSILKNKNAFLCKQGNVLEVLASPGGQVIVDHQQKQLAVLPKDKQELNTSDYLNFFENYIDTILMAYEKVNYKSVSERVGSYEYTFKSGIYSKMVLLYDKKDSIPLTVRYYPVQKMAIPSDGNRQHAVVVEIDYRNFNSKPLIDPKQLSIASYVTIKGTNVSLAPKYKQYELLNFLIPQDGNYK
jgi:hypothetical protein